MTLWSVIALEVNCMRHRFITFHIDVCKGLKQIQDLISIYMA